MSSPLLREKLRLLGDHNPDFLAMRSHEHLDHVRDAAMVLGGGKPNSLLDPWVDAQVEGCGFQGWHIHDSHTMM